MSQCLRRKIKKKSSDAPAGIKSFQFLCKCLNRARRSSDVSFNIWNSLPDYVVDVDTVDIFKSRLDKFWKDQDVMFDCDASSSLCGRTRSEVVL